MFPGDPVQINKVWAANESGLYRSWVSGYQWVRQDGNCAIVSPQAGTYQFQEVRYPLADVRPDTGHHG